MCISRLASLGQGAPNEIAATVIDQGVLRHIPYSSHRAGYLEFNVYGDPERPAGIEIGIVEGTATDMARRECRDFLQTLLEPSDARVFDEMNLTLCRKERDGLTFEVTPSSAGDAYGGWWISIYDLRRLERSRASAQELADIVSTPEEDTAESGEARGDYSTTAPSRAATRHKSSGNASSGSNRVYVRGYYRRDGTYVRPHTRSRAAGRRGG